jgi:hypothetical protein
LNLVRSVTFLLRLLDEDAAASASAAADSGSPVAGSSSGSGVGGFSGGSISSSSSRGGGGIGVGFAAGTGNDDDDDDSRPLSPSGTKLLPLQRLTDDLRRLRMSLSPLRTIEESLVRIISPDAPRSTVGAGAGGSSALPTERAFEVRVRSGSRWKTFFKGNGAATVSKANGRGHEELSNARRVIEACREDIVALWNHPAVRASLAEQSVALEFQSGLYVFSLILP